MPRFGFAPVEGDPFADSRSAAPAIQYARVIGGQPPNTGFRKDVNDLLKGIGETVNAFGQIGNSLMGDTQVEIDAEGNVSPIDPRLVDAAAITSGLVGVGGLSVPKPRNALGVFGGIHAKTADLEALAEAKFLRDEHQFGPEEIWQRTGWAQGPDGQWRFEISDAKSKFDDTRLKPWSTADFAEAREIRKSHDYANRTKAEQAQIDKIVEARLGAATNLSALLDHPELYEAYPDLKSMRVERTERDEFGGYYDPANNLVAMTPKGTTAVSHNRGNEGHSVLLHEVQHAIQSREGFAHGGSPSDPEVATGGYNIAVKLAKRREELKAKLSSSPITDEADAVEYAQITRALARMGTMEPGAAGYQTLAGEVEARNVETRFAKEKQMQKNGALSFTIKNQLGAPAQSEDVPRYSQWVRRPREWIRSIE
jgi:hypothetical protein